MPFDKDLPIAQVNREQLVLMYQMFQIYPWSYVHDNPFDLMRGMNGYEKTIEEAEDS